MKPEIVDAGGDVIAVAGRLLTLMCRVQTGSPRPSITWYAEGRVLLVDAGTLVLGSATPTDAGRYTCIADNAAGNDVRHFDVHVIGRSVACTHFHMRDVRTKIRRRVVIRNIHTSVHSVQCLGLI